MNTDGDRECNQTGENTSRGGSSTGCFQRDGSQGRAVTPVVANVLLVAVVLVVAMVVTVLAFGLLDGVNGDPPMASFDDDRATDGAVSLVHLGGDTLETEQLRIAFGDHSYPVDSYVSAERITSGTTIGPIYPSDAEEVRLIWRDRDSSEVLYSTSVGGTVPRYLRFDDDQIGSYGENQDDDGKYRITTGARTLALQNNGWKYVPYETKLTDDSVLAFDFKSTDEGEIHGIGLEDDTSPSSDRIFKLFGNQTGWGRPYESYDKGDGWVHYEIPVGDRYTASQRQNIGYVAFVNDLDSGVASNSWFRNVRVFNATAPKMKVTINDTTQRLPVKGYGSQDYDGTYELQDDGKTLKLTNNTWKYLPVNLTITDRTTVSFEFKSTSEGEIHAVGFENDDTETASRFVTLNGTQDWGDGDVSYNRSKGWVSYEITIDDQTSFAQSDISRLVFVNDDDEDGSGVSLFRNVTISKAG